MTASLLVRIKKIQQNSKLETFYPCSSQVNKIEFGYGYVIAVIFGSSIIFATVLIYIYFTFFFVIEPLNPEEKSYGEVHLEENEQESLTRDTSVVDGIFLLP